MTKSKIQWWDDKQTFLSDDGTPIEMIFNYKHIRYNEETKQYAEIKREVTISPRQ